ncbi:intermembrane phospholipid transport protein YdbH family protein [Arenibaculum pallidiluteum]|uniref:intermembrane phospholipid transport protein YdbH family protein n=1 Tax=Arenibaculum pallidiluteum TaxID=2812559 RepID=UPI001A956D1C|nr:YdbH domain-containing protein [Arenibaculum pallidiluteum]
MARPIVKAGAIIVLACALLVLLLGGIWLAAPGLASGALEKRLRGAGFPAASVAVERFGAAGAVLTVMLDAATQQRLGTVEVTWSLDSLMSLSAERVEVRRARLDLGLGEDGVPTLAGRPLKTDFGEGGAATGAEDASDEVALPLRVLRILDGELRLALPGGMVAGALSADLAQTPGGWTGRAALDAGAEGIELRLNPAGGGTAAQVQVRMSDLGLLAPALGGRGTLRAELAPDGRGWAGDAELTLSGATLASAPDTEAALAARGRLSVAGAEASFAPADCLSVSLGAMRLGTALRVHPVTICAASAPDAPLLRWRREEGVALMGRLRPFAAAAEISGMPVRLSLGVLDVTVAGQRLELAPEDLDLFLPGQGVAVRGLAGRIVLGGAAGQGLEATVRGTTSDAARPARFVDLPFELRASGDPRGGIVLAVSVQGPVPMRLSGRHDIASGAGSLRLSKTEAVFGPGGLALDAVSPALAARLAEMEGRIAATGRIGWGAEASGGAELRLAGLGFRIGAATVRGLDAVMTATSLQPLVLPPGQKVAVAGVDLGLPLTRGLAEIGYSDGRLAVAAARWDWAGGTVRAEPFSFDPAAPRSNATLVAEGLDLGTLLGMMDVDGLEAEGRLSGSLPLSVGAGRIAVEGGALSAAAPGQLRYDPAAPPAALASGAEGTDLLLKALTDFRYDTLEVGLDGVAGGEMQARLAIKGRNPGFYDGYPVSLTVTLSGALDTILRRGLDAYRIPDTMLEHMREFDAKTD